MIDKYGFEVTWNFITLLTVIGCVSLLILIRILKKESKSLLVK